MKFTEVKEIPKARGRNNLQLLIKEFMSQNIKYARVDLKEGEYSCMKVAYASLFEAIRKSEEPVKVRKRGNELYLVRTDI